MRPSCSTALIAARQQKKYGVGRKGVLENGGIAICLVACQGVSELQPSHTCHDSKIPTSALASIYQTFAELQCVWLSQSHLMGIGLFPFTLIPQLRSWLVRICLIPASALASHKGDGDKVLRLSGNEADLKSGGTLAKEGDYRGAPATLAKCSMRLELLGLHSDSAQVFH